MKPLDQQIDQAASRRQAAWLMMGQERVTRAMSSELRALYSAVRAERAGGVSGTPFFARSSSVIKPKARR